MGLLIIIFSILSGFFELLIPTYLYYHIPTYLFFTNNHLILLFFLSPSLIFQFIKTLPGKKINLRPLVSYVFLNRSAQCTNYYICCTIFYSATHLFGLIKI